MGQICPALSTSIWTLAHGLENNHTFKWYSGIFPTILTYIIMLDKCQNNVWLFSNPGDNILFSLKFHEARIPEWNLWFENYVQKYSFCTST